MEEKFICKIASPEEMDRKWDYEIENNSDDRDNWITWKAEAISEPSGPWKPGGAEGIFPDSFPLCWRT